MKLPKIELIFFAEGEDRLRSLPNSPGAYDAAPDNAVIRTLDGINAGPLTANRSATVTLCGGYNAAYTAQTGGTDLQGKVTLQKGPVIFDRVMVR